MSCGRRGRTRTCDPLLRRQMLYPPELRARLRSSLILNYSPLLALTAFSLASRKLGGRLSFSRGCRRSVVRLAYLLQEFPIQPAADICSTTYQVIQRGPYGADEAPLFRLLQNP
jgi:hypothetical protein